MKKSGLILQTSLFALLTASTAYSYITGSVTLHALLLISMLLLFALYGIILYNTGLLNPDKSSQPRTPKQLKTMLMCGNIMLVCLAAIFAYDAYDYATTGGSLAALIVMGAVLALYIAFHTYFVLRRRGCSPAL